MGEKSAGGAPPRSGAGPLFPVAGWEPRAAFVPNTPPFPPAGRFRGASANVAVARCGGGEGRGRPRRGKTLDGGGAGGDGGPGGQGSWGLPVDISGRGGSVRRPPSADGFGDSRASPSDPRAGCSPPPQLLLIWSPWPALSSSRAREGPRCFFVLPVATVVTARRPARKGALSHVSPGAKAAPSPPLLPAGLRGPPRAGGGARRRPSGEGASKRGQLQAPPTLHQLPGAASLGSRQATGRFNWS